MTDIIGNDVHQIGGEFSVRPRRPLQQRIFEKVKVGFIQTPRARKRQQQSFYSLIRHNPMGVREFRKPVNFRVDFVKFLTGLAIHGHPFPKRKSLARFVGNGEGQWSATA